MRKIGLAILLALVSACSPGNDVPTATAAADNFHKQFNAGDYVTIYDTSDKLLKNAAPSKDFVALLAGVRSKLGEYQKAEAPGWNDQVTTNGHFVTLIYHSKFARADAEENFVFRIDGGRAVLVGWHINSQALIQN